MWSVTFSLVRLQTPRWWFVSSSVSSEGRMWKKPSWRQRRGFTRTSKMAVWTWMLQSRESSTNRLHLREAASTPTASRPKKAAAANQRQKLQTHRTDGRTDTDPLHQAPPGPLTRVTKQDLDGLYFISQYSHGPNTDWPLHTGVQSSNQTFTSFGSIRTPTAPESHSSLVLCAWTRTIPDPNWITVRTKWIPQRKSQPESRRVSFQHPRPPSALIRSHLGCCDLRGEQRGRLTETRPWSGLQNIKRQRLRTGQFNPWIEKVLNH